MTTPESPVEAIFSVALEKRSPEERAAYLDQACGSDPDLRRRVEQLLEVHPQLGSFLQGDARDLLAADVTWPYRPAPRPGHGDRPVQAAGADRRRRHGHRLHGRADAAGPPQGRR